MRRTKRCLSTSFLLSLGLAWLGSCRHKPPRHPAAAPKKRLRVQTYTESSTVKDLTALNGALWIATDNGLIRWNIQTRSARILTEEDGLPDRNVTSVAPDAQGNLWVATGAGIVKYDGARWIEYSDCPIGSSVAALTPAPDGSSVWAGGPKGLARHVFGRWMLVTGKLSVTSILNDPSGKFVWVGAEDGLYRCTPTGCGRLGKAQGVMATAIRSLSYSQEGVVGVGTASGRDVLLLFDGSRWRTLRAPKGVFLNWASWAMGRVYVGTASALYVLRERDSRCRMHKPVVLEGAGGTACLVPARVPVPTNVTAVETAMGTLWLGTRSLGVFRFDGARYVLYRTSDLAKGADFLSVACSGPIYCYMATGSVAYRFDGSQWTAASKLLGIEGAQVVTFVQGPGRNQATAIFRDELGSLRLAVTSGEGWQERHLAQPIRSERPMSASVGIYDNKGNLWLAVAQLDANGEPTPFGLVQVTPSGRAISHRNFQGGGNPDPLSVSLPNTVNALAEVGNRIWVATNDGACRIGPPGTLKCFGPDNGLPSEVVRGIAAFGTGSLWVTSSEGVARLMGNHFQAVDLEDMEGALRNLVAQKGYLWIGTTEGLVRLSPPESTTVFDEDDGLIEPSVQFLAADSKGRVWVLHPGGLSIVTP